MAKFRLHLHFAFLLVCASAQVGAQTPFVTSFGTSVPLRNNYTGYVGMQFTVGASPLTVSALGSLGPNGEPKLVNAATGVDVPGGSGGTVTSTISSLVYTNLPSPIVLPAHTSYYLLFPVQVSQSSTYWYDVTPVTTTSDAAVNGAVYTDAGGTPVLAPNTAGESYGPASFLYVVGTSSTQPPVVTITGANLSASVLSAMAVAAPGLTITSLQFQVDNQNFGPPQTPGTSTTSYSSYIGYDYNDLLGGLHSLTAIATDSAGNVGTSSAVQFYNPQVGAYSSTPYLTGQSPQTLRNDYGGATGRFVGMKFTVGSDHLAVFEIGRFAAPGNKQSHIVKLVDAATGLDVPGASTTVAMAGSTPGQYAYGNFAILDGQPAQVVLRANASYYLVSQEFTGGDEWYDIAPVMAGAQGTVTAPVYQNANGSYVEVTNTPGASYGPVNLVAYSMPPGPAYVSSNLSALGATTLFGTIPLQISASSDYFYIAVLGIQPYLDGAPFGPALPAASPASANSTTPYALDTTKIADGSHVLSFTTSDAAGDVGTATYQVTVKNNQSQPSTATLISGFTPTFLRSNFSGYVGMEFTVGSSPVTVSSLGRLCIAGNSGGHQLKLVQASNGTDLSGGSAAVSMSGCTVGQFTYAPLATPLTLPAGASYYFASQETAGGDQWYDYGPVSMGFGATIVAPVYFDGSKWVAVASPSSSYVPLNLQFALSTSSSAVTVSIAMNGSTLTATAASTAGPITGVQYQVDGLNLLPPVTTAPYTLTLPNLDFATHLIGAVAVDSAGNSAISNSIVYGSSSTGGAPYLLAASLNSFSGTKLRNDYTGWVGFQFTTSATFDDSPYTEVKDFAAIGMTCIAGNSQPTFIKLVLASTGADVPGSLAWIDPIIGCANAHYGTPYALNGVTYPGTIGTYANLTAPLLPSTTYYLVAQETAGGDPWYDLAPSAPQEAVGTRVVVIQPRFTIDGPVYFDGTKYVLVAQPNYSYVGLFLGGETQVP